MNNTQLSITRSILFLVLGTGVLFYLIQGCKSQLPTPGSFGIYSLPTSYIDNFETGNTEINPNLLGSTGGFALDATFAGNTIDNPFVLPGGPPGSYYDAQIFGTLTDQGNGQYPGFELEIFLNNGNYYTATTFTGVMMDMLIPAQSASGQAENQVQVMRFNVAVARTQPVTASPAGICTSGCYDHFGDNLSTTPSATWQHLTFPFSGMTPQFAPLTPNTLSPTDLTQILYLEWLFSSNNVKGSYPISYQVDNVRFY